MTTDPLRQFEAEHQEALGVLKRLEAAALALQAGADQMRRMRHTV